MSTPAYFFVTVGNPGETTRLVQTIAVPGWPSIGTEVVFGDDDDSITVEIDSVYFMADAKVFEIQGKSIRPEHIGLPTSCALADMMFEQGWQAADGAMRRRPHR